MRGDANKWNFSRKDSSVARPAAGAGGGDVKAVGLEKTASGLEAGEGAVKAVSTSQ